MQTKAEILVPNSSVHQPYRHAFMTHPIIKHETAVPKKAKARIDPIFRKKCLCKKKYN